eukprot:PhM_4_TR16151/c0_g1_i1/m.77129/K14570/REX1, REXO1, RNH70; RNA exonuclease 1
MGKKKNKINGDAAADAAHLATLYNGSNNHPSVTLNLQSTRRTNIAFCDVAKAACWCMCDDAENVKWCCVAGKPLITRVLVLALDSYTEEDLFKTTQGVRCLRCPGWQYAQVRVGKGSEENTLFDFFMQKKVEQKPKTPTAAVAQAPPATSCGVLAALDFVREEKEMLERREKKRERDDTGNSDVKNVHEAKDAEYVLTLEQCVASIEDLRHNLFPLEDPNTGLLPDGFAATTDPGVLEDDAVAAPLVVAMDCEMVLTEKGSELARVSLVDANEPDKVLYDALVKPRNPIVNYVTAYSGITEELLQDVNTTLEDVRDVICNKYIRASTVVVGHSLENDFTALRLVHKRVCDTSLLYPHPAGHPRKQSLRYLTRKFLDRHIQMDAEGHCSVEDATACLELLHMKRVNGKDFGSERTPRENISTILERNNVHCHFVDRASNIRQFINNTTDAILVKDDDAALAKAVKCLTSQEHERVFVWAHLCEAANDKKEEDVEAQLAPFFEKVPSNTVVMIVGMRPPKAKVSAENVSTHNEKNSTNNNNNNNNNVAEYGFLAVKVFQQQESPIIAEVATAD